jgi:hypothetical protein
VRGTGWIRCVYCLCRRFKGRPLRVVSMLVMCRLLPWTQGALSVPNGAQSMAFSLFIGSLLIGYTHAHPLSVPVRILSNQAPASFGYCIADVCLWPNCLIRKSHVIFTSFYKFPTHPQVKLLRYKRGARMSPLSSDRLTPNTYTNGFLHFALRHHL